MSRRLLLQCQTRSMSNKIQWNTKQVHKVVYIHWDKDGVMFLSLAPHFLSQPLTQFIERNTIPSLGQQMSILQHSANYTRQCVRSVHVPICISEHPYDILQSVGWGICIMHTSKCTPHCYN